VSAPLLRRFLNIASISSCVLCVAAFGLAIRSAYWIDSVVWSNQRTGVITCSSFHERVNLLKTNTQSSMQLGYNWEFLQIPIGDATSKAYDIVESNRGVWWLGYHWPRRNIDAYFVAPYWFLVLMTGSLALICRLRWPWRFTLRHLFIATTFLAIVMGMIACLDRSWIGK
jgi:hypothetical protein